jgi:hypothetical protein
VPTVNVITTAFAAAAKMRSQILGIEPEAILAMQHPLASRTQAELEAIARDIAASVARGLVVA